jgi:hypothetical protein
MAEHKLRELYPVFDQDLGYLVDLLIDEEITPSELRRQAMSVGYSEHDIDRAIAFASEGA